MNSMDEGHRPIQTGSCLCGEVRYEIRGPLTSVLNCHCTMCRKAHGAAFRTRASVDASEFVWLAGEELLTAYESSPGQFRTFCSCCGSNMITRFADNPAIYGFPLGTLDTDPGIKPECHVFVREKAPWIEIRDGLPQHETLPGDGQERSGQCLWGNSIAE